MRKQIFILVFILISVISSAQTYVGFETGFVRVHGDVNGSGLECELSSLHHYNNGLVLGIKAGIGFSSGGKDQSQNFLYNNSYKTFKPTLGLAININSGLTLTPALSFGLINYTADGWFSDSAIGSEYYETWGPTYINRDFTQSTSIQSYTTSSQATGLIFSPSLQLAKVVNNRLSLQSSITYSFLSTDGFDAYVFPTWSNRVNEFYYSIKIGIQWRLGTVD